MITWFWVSLFVLQVPAIDVASCLFIPVLPGCFISVSAEVSDDQFAERRDTNLFLDLHHLEGRETGVGRTKSGEKEGRGEYAVGEV